MTAVAHIQKGMLEAYSFLFFWQFYYPYDTHVYTPTGLGLERDLDPLLRFDSDKPSFGRGEGRAIKVHIIVRSYDHKHTSMRGEQSILLYGEKS